MNGEYVPELEAKIFIYDSALMKEFIINEKKA